MSLRLLTLLLTAIVVATALGSPGSSVAATADSILANKRVSNNGCTLKRMCVTWSRGKRGNGTLFGGCLEYGYRWDCPIHLH